MAELTDTAMREIMQDLTRTIRDSHSDLLSESRSRNRNQRTAGNRMESDLKISSALEEFRKQGVNPVHSAFKKLSGSTNDLGDQTSLVGSMMNEVVNKTDPKHFDNMAAGIRASMRKSQDPLLQAMSHTVTSLGDAVDTFNDLNSPEVAEAFDRVAKSGEEIERNAELYEQLARVMGTTVEHVKMMGLTAADVADMADTLDDDGVILELYQQVEQSNAVIEENKQIQKDLAQKLRITENELTSLSIVSSDLTDTQRRLNNINTEAVDAQNNVNQRSEALEGAFWKLKAAALAVGTILYQTAKSAAQTGQQFEMFDAWLAGLSSQELNALQQEYARTINSTGQGLDAFNESVTKGVLANAIYYGGAQEYARVQSEAFRLSKLGAEGAEAQRQAQEQTTKRFKELHNATGMTADGFIQLQEGIWSNASVQTMMYRINQRDRAAKMNELTLTYEKLNAMGLEAEQAQRVLDVFTEIGAKSPKERMKEAAKMQAVMGATGMGDIGQRLRDLTVRGQTGTEEYAALVQQAQQGLGQMMEQGGLQTEMMIRQMIESAGLQNIFGPEAATAAMRTQEGQNYEPVQKEVQNSNKILEQIRANLGDWGVTLSQYAFGAGEIVGQLMTNLSGILAALTTGGLLKMIFDFGKTFFAGGTMTQSLVSGLKGGASFIFKPITSILGGMLKLLGPLAALWGAWEAGNWIGENLINPIFPDSWKEGIGETVARGLAMLGNEDAKRSVAAMEKLEKERIDKAYEKIAADHKKGEDTKSTYDLMIAEMQKTRKAIEDGTVQNAEQAKQQLKAQENVIQILLDQGAITQEAADKALKVQRLQNAAAR